MGVVAQRLIRTICPECREPYKVSAEVLKELRIEDKVPDFYRGKGCPHCLQSGYKGRQGVYELLVPDENVRKLILGCHSGEEIRVAAEKKGMKTLRQLAFAKLLAGNTTPEEVLRVTQETEE